MQLSESSLQILKNFSSINQNIMIEAGNVIKTISEARNILATAVIDDEFPEDTGIYDLNEFLNVLGLVDSEPHIKWGPDQYCIIQDSSGRSKIKYYFSPRNTLTYPEKDIKMPDGDVKFELDNSTLNKIKRAASALGHEEVSITGSNNVITLSVLENENSTSNVYSIDVDGEYTSDNFNFIMTFLKYFVKSLCPYSFFLFFHRIQIRYANTRIHVF